jgi:DNA repair protein RecO (recombination protein O)
MIHATRGIVFRTVKFSETSVVSKIYTEKFGMQSYLVNGVRTEKAKTKAALLQVMSQLDLRVYHHEHRHLHRIKEMQSFYLYRSLLFTPLKSSLGLFMMEVLNLCIKEEEPNENMFQFISHQLTRLDQAATLEPDSLLHFLLQLSGLLGFFPQGKFEAGRPAFDLTEGRFTSGSTPHPQMLLPPVSENFSKVIHAQKILLSSPERRALLDHLLNYYRLHVPEFRIPKSLRVLDEVFHA